jgi:hypothetical protein
MLILGYLLQSGVQWNQADVHLKMVIDDPSGREKARRNLLEITEQIRIGASVDVIVREGRTFNEILHEGSSQADLIMMGMSEPGEDFDEDFTRQLDRIADLPTTVLVLAGQDISFGEVLVQKDRME